MKFRFPYTARQKELVNHPARILWCGTGTKTGKSAASYCWLIDGLLNGQAVAFVGPWFFRSRSAFDSVKTLLEPFIASRVVRVNEARLQIVGNGGGFFDFLSADNANCLYGGNYDRVVIDESSRCPREIYPAAITTISATRGKLRLLFNLELGNKNWAIANLLRVQRLSVEERERTGEDFMTFPTDPQLVAPALVEILRSQMPLPLWEALYLAQIPESDASLFRNLDRIFTGTELEQPRDGERYFLAADLARKSNWTVVTVISDDGRVVACDRFNQISWSLQVERVGLLYRTFRCAKVIYDATGVGDAVGEELEKAGMTVEPFIFTVPSRRQLIEELVLCCDAGEISVPNTTRFQVYRQELESMEIQLDGTMVRYAVPSNANDDAIMSLALAVHAYRQSRGTVLGFIDLLKRQSKEISQGVRNFFGELHKPKPAPPKPAAAPTGPVETRVEGFKVWQQTHRAPPCPNCASPCTCYMSNGRGGVKLHCKQCQADDGVLPGPTEKPGHVHRWRTIPGNQVKCDDCEEQRYISLPPAVNGMTFAQYNNRFDRSRR